MLKNTISKSTSYSVCLMVAMLFLATACPRPLRFGREGIISDPAFLLRKLDERSARINAIKAEAKAQIKTPNESGTVGQLIAAKRPALVHLETLDFFGKPVAMLASNGERILIYDQKNNYCYSGSACAANISIIVPMAIEPRDLVSILLGDVPRIMPTSIKMDVDAQAHAYKLVLSKDSIVQKLWIDTENLVPVRSEVIGLKSYNLRFDDYQELGGTLFPRKIELETVNPDGSFSGTNIRLRYKDIELNIPLESEMFNFSFPPNCQHIELNELNHMKK